MQERNTSKKNKTSRTGNTKKKRARKTPKPDPTPKQNARENAGRNRPSLDGHLPEEEARVQRDRLQETQGKCKTSGPPGTAEVSHFPAPKQAVVEKQQRTENNDHQELLS